MRRRFLALALSLLAPVLAAPAAQAADCRVNFTANNTTVYRVALQVESRTRANMTWHDGVVPPFLIFAAQDRNHYLRPGERVARTARFPILGCNVARELRVTQRCYLTDPATGRATSLMTERILHPWGQGFHRPRDITINVHC